MKLANKVTAGGFWDLQKVIYVDCLQKWRQTLNKEYNSILLDLWSEDFNEKQFLW